MRDMHLDLWRLVKMSAIGAVVDVPTTLFEEGVEEFAAELGLVVLAGFVGVDIALETFDEVEDFFWRGHDDGNEVRENLATCKNSVGKWRIAMRASGIDLFLCERWRNFLWRADAADVIQNDLDRFLRFIDQLDQIHVAGADVAVFFQALLDPFEQAAPIGAAV
jgi:hypothetical protein